MPFKRFTLLLAALLALAGLPLVIVPPSGPASAGLSAGFLSVMDHTLRLMLIIPVGLMASHLRGDGRVVLPLSFLLMYLVGALLELDMMIFPMARLFILGAILLFALTMSVGEGRAFQMSALLGASVAYHLGSYGMLVLPTLASPLYYIIGQLLALVLVIGISFSIGLIVFSEWEAYRKRGNHNSSPPMPSSS